MPQQVTTAVENNFTKGFITEATALNFPENAATDTDNCEYTLIGDVLRRQGINNEINFTTNPVTRDSNAVSTYRWTNVGGDGLTQIVVEQVGATLYFYRSSTATNTNPLSNQLLASTVSVSGFLVNGGTFDNTLECQFADGNGYLFVYHPNCDPFFCTYTAGVITATVITIQIRDFNGIPEPTLAVNTRPLPAQTSSEHIYNLTNQGWSQGNNWIAVIFNSVVPQLGVQNFPVQAGLGVALGDFVNMTTNGPMQIGPFTVVPAGTLLMSGSVVAYSGSTITVNVISFNNVLGGSGTSTSLSVIPGNHGYINTWVGSVGNYPSNADVWWYFKDTTGAFNPALTFSQVTLATGNAPQGHFILNAFNQNRALASGGIGNFNSITTTVRPRTGTWFQGRVWYAGADAQQAAVGDAPYYTWTENIYFSQIVTQTSDFGICYQTNDPTSQNLFDLLPSDGGVIQIQGAGSIYKLFPMQNAMLVFAANGVWYITGSGGIGFSANDYTIVKLSNVRSISSTSFVNVNGLPMFWNEEGIYSVEAAKQGTSLLNTPLHVNPLEVIPVTLGTILTYYQGIPLSSKKYVRGDYDPINYIVQWVYRDTEATNVAGRYTYNKILNHNTSNKAFFPYTVDTSMNSINGIVYVVSPGGITAPPATFKYVSSQGAAMTFADEHDNAFVDWGNINYVSHFTTGYKLRGQGIKKFQPQYIQIFTRTNGENSAYKIQGTWDYSNNRSSGRWSSSQLVNNGFANYDTIFRRHKMRGHGYALQFKVTSSDGIPFDIQGWSALDTTNVGT